jgi:hypothetical protein
MSLSINAAQLADTGFVLFVVFTCGYSLFANKEERAGKSKKWMQELTVLQETIRELIGEASSASSQLDRTLQRRKLELEKLLTKIDASPQYSPDFPNDSWAERPAPQRPQQQQRYVEERAASPRPAQQQTRVQPKPQAPTQRRPVPLSQQSELARRIEVFLDDKKPTRMAAEESSDPAAYKIARRLLESGKEIHVVAKKVGLPIEEIRVLDSMVKGASEPIDETHLVRAIEEETLSVPPTYSRAKQIVSRPEIAHEIDLEDEEISFTSQQSPIKRATTFL